MLAWGNAPGIRSHHKQALKARFNPAGFKMLNRAFSAGRFVSRILGRCPRLKMNAAPLALKKRKRREVKILPALFLLGAICPRYYFTASLNWILPYLRTITNVWV
jgi:hypothetical protein